MKLALVFGGRSIPSKTGTSLTLDSISYNVCFRCHQLQCMFQVPHCVKVQFDLLFLFFAPSLFSLAVYDADNWSALLQFPRYRAPCVWLKLSFHQRQQWPALTLFLIRVRLMYALGINKFIFRKVLLKIFSIPNKFFSKLVYYCVPQDTP